MANAIHEKLSIKVDCEIDDVDRGRMSSLLVADVSELVAGINDFEL